MKLFCVLCCLVNGVALKKPPEQNHIFENGPITDKVEGRIAGGEEVDTIIQFPFVVEVTVRPIIFCSGAIISENYIITAAQCVEYFRDIKDIEVRAGNVVRGEGTLIPIAEAVIHPYYDPDNYDFDVAYMRTVTPLVLGEDMEPGVLVDTEGRGPYEITVTGWGSRGDNEQPYERYNVLRKVKLNYVFGNACDIDYRGTRRSITKNMFCAEAENYTKDAGACFYDNGSPAADGYMIYGLYSDGIGCGPGMYPSIFSNLQVRDIREFITEGTGVEYENH